MRTAIRSAVIAALLMGMSTLSQARGPNTYELLATLPDTTVAQQETIHRIESERRSAYAELFAKQRAEREQIDAGTAQKLRKALGDEGYRKYAEWKLSHGRDQRRMHARGMRGDRPYPGMRGGPGMSGGPDMPEPADADDNSEGPNT
jgi:hypothetical protein